jgi:hypothetical protein
MSGARGSLIILATQEAEIRRIEVPSQSRKRVRRPSLQKPITKRAGGMTQGEGPEFKPQYQKKNQELFYILIMNK